jgi:hypothetical protein
MAEDRATLPPALDELRYDAVGLGWQIARLEVG